MTTSTLKKVSSADAVALNSLLRQLVHDPSTYKAVPIKTLRSIAANKQTILVVAKEDKQIVGVGILFIITKFRGRYAYVEDMVVDEAHRGKGLGKAILQKLISAAKAKGIETIELSTRPSRVPANKLYQKMGFKPKETNVYRLKL
jgi:ribosomal protein S18 acetylase RimI-like enzyme